MKNAGIILVIALALSWTASSSAQTPVQTPAETPTAAPVAQTPTAPANDAYERALKRYAAKEYADAAAEFEEAAKADPTNAAKLYYAGYAYYKNGQMEKAVGFFDRAYAADPNFTPKPPPTPTP